jgi:hypothetical protein
VKTTVRTLLSGMQLSIVWGQWIERMSHQHHEIAGLALKGSDIPKNSQERTRDMYHWKFAGRARGPNRFCHDTPTA